MIRYNDFLVLEKNENTYLKSAIEILKHSEKPLTIEEICRDINKKGINSIPKSSFRSVSTIVLSHTKGKESSSISKTRNKKGIIYFEIVTESPYRFKLIEEIKSDLLLEPEDVNPNGEIQKIPDEEIEEPFEKIYFKNPFRQAICILGGSGIGKSTTIMNLLESEGHEFGLIIPSASTTGLLSQFSPSKSGYIPSKLGKMITKAYDNPTQLFTAIIDECHKSNIIEMINDELLQAISTKRNNGKRFISLDDDTAELYKNVEEYRGNILIPDNFGFVFISSKPDVILHNDDFFNRIDIVMLKSYKEENLTSIDQLKVLSDEEKNSLKSNND
jgi:hypothetical protein